MPDVSIIIRTMNEVKYIAQTLNAVFSQNFKDFEVIIVDSGSVDNTLQIVQAYDVVILQIRPEDFTYGYALNKGAQAAKGKYLANLSGHAIPYDALWLRSLIENFDDPFIAGVSSKHIPLPGGRLYFSRGLLQPLYKRLPWSKLLRLFLFHNASSAIRKELWETVPFCEALVAHEDHDWGKKMMHMGYRIAYEPRSVVLHSHHETLLEWFRRTWTGIRILTKIHFGKT